MKLREILQPAEDPRGEHRAPSRPAGVAAQTTGSTAPLAPQRSCPAPKEGTPVFAHRPETTGRRSLLAVATLLALLGLGLPHPPWGVPTPPPGGFWAALGSAGTAHAQTTPPPATPTPTPAPPPRAPTRIIGDIAVNTTWARSESPILVQTHLTVKDGAVLTIEAGVEVRVVNRARITVGKSNAGSLVAVGTATQPIVFTSTSATGSWAGLRMQSGTLATTRLEHVRIQRSRYGIELSGAPSGITLRNVSIQHVEKDAIYFERTNPILRGLTISNVGEKALNSPDTTNFQLRDSTVRGALFLPTAVNPTLQNNTFHDLSGSRLPLHLVATVTASSAGATPKAVIEVLPGTITQNTSWPAFTYRVLGQIAVGGAGSPTLTLAAGVTFRFAEASTLFRQIPRLVVGVTGSGGLVAVGTATAPVRFTADVTDPAKPFFGSGLALGSGTLATTRLEHIEIEAAQTAISLNGTPAGITLRSGTIRRVRDQGIEVRNASPVLDSWTLDTAAAQRALHITGTKPFTLRRSTLHGTLHAPTVTSATLENNTFRSGFHAPAATSATLKNNTFHSGFHAPKLETVNFSKNTFVNYGSSASPVAWIHPNLVVDFLASIPNATADTVVEVGGATLTRSMTWPVATFRIVDRLTVEGAAAPTLTLTPGTTLRFTARPVPVTGSLTIGSAAAGGLVAVGTATAPIRFTADATPPVAGSWGGIALHSKTSATTRLEHIEIEFARTALLLKDTPAGVTLQNGTIRKVRDDGIRVEDASPVLDGWTLITDVDQKSLHITGSQQFSLRRSTLYGTLYAPLAMSAILERNTFRSGFHVPSMTTITFNNNTFVNYGASASSFARVHPNLVADIATRIPGATAQTVIEVAGPTLLPVPPGLTLRTVNPYFTKAILSRSASWPARVYRISGHVAVGGTARPILTLAPGTTLRFGPHRYEIRSAEGTAHRTNKGTLSVGAGRPGGLVAVGTATAPILFSTQQLKPTPSQWSGLRFGSHMLGTSRLESVIVEHAVVGIELADVPAEVQFRSGGTIRHVKGNGVRIVSGTASFDGWTIHAGEGSYAFWVRQHVSEFSLSNSTLHSGIHAPYAADAVLENNDIYHTSSSTSNPSPLRSFVHPNLVEAVATSLVGATPKTELHVAGGELGKTQTWPARTYRINLNLTISGPSAPVLTLAPGATLRCAGGRLTIGGSTELIRGAHVRNRGGLVAVGTAAAPILFTIVSEGGPPVGQWWLNGSWDGLYFNEWTLPVSQLKFVTIERSHHGLVLDKVTKGVGFQGGTIRYTGHGVKIVAGTPSLDNWTITNLAPNAHALWTNSHDGFTLQNSSLQGSLYAPNARNALLKNNTYQDSAMSRVHPNLIAAVAAGDSGATAQTVLTVPGATITSSGTWPARTYVIQRHLTVAGENAPILTLEAGSTLRFAENTNLNIGSAEPGGLVAVGTKEAPILFTANNAKPVAGAWNGVNFGSQTLATSRLEFVNVEFGGESTLSFRDVPRGLHLRNGTVRHASGGGIYLQRSSPTISHWTISSTGSHGLASFSGSPELSHLTISGAGGDGMHLSNFSGRLEHNTITTSAGDGVECLGSGRIELFDNRITGNTGRGLACAATAHVERNTITGNGVGVELTAAPVLLAIHHNDLSGNTVPMKSTATAGADARWNWWGGATGPSGIVGRVRTSPWLGATPTAPFRIDSAVASPESFAPGGSASTATVTAKTPQTATWSLTLRNGAGTTVRSFTGTGTLFAQDWDGKNTASQALPAGSYRYTLSAQPSAAGGTAAAPVVGDLTLVAGDLVAEIADPGPEARLRRKGSLEVRGRALGTGFSAYELDYAAGAEPGANSFVRIARGTTAAATAAALGTWNTSFLSQGVYTLRLRTLGAGNAAAEERVTVALLGFGSVAVSPRHFSPNGDKRQDVINASATATVPGDWTAQVRDAAGTVLRSYSGTGILPRVVWDGRNAAGVTQPEGTYTLALRMAVDTGKPAEVTGAMILDVTPPQAVITAPAANTAILDYTDQTITGTASDQHFASYELRSTAGGESVAVLKRGTAAVVAGTLGTLTDTATAPRYVNGNSHSLELHVEDRAGNRTIASRALRFDRIRLSGFAVSPRSIDPELDQVARFSYRLDRAAKVTVQMVADRKGGMTHTLIEEKSVLPGAMVTTWNGKDATGKPLPRDFYHLRVTARDTAGRSAVYDAPEKLSRTAFDPSLYYRDLRINGGHVGLNTREALADVGFDPYRNDELRFDYIVTNVGRHSVMVRAVTAEMKTSEIELRRPALTPAGANHVIWTGRLANGKRHTGPFSVIFNLPRAVPDLSLLVWSPEFRVESFRANPYVFQPAHAQVVHISYALQSAAKVQIDIVDPEGNHWLRLQEPTVQQPGAHQLEWSGRNAAGKIAAPEGLYTVEVTATETGGRKERTVRRGNLLMYR